VLGGASPEHLDRALEWLKSRWGLSVRAEYPPVAYREAPVSPIVGIQGAFRRAEDGPNGTVTSCVLDVEPLPQGEGFEFEDGVDDFDLVKPFAGAIEEGVRRGLRQGPLAGYPVVGLRVRCAGGELDVLESTDEHFRGAGERAIRAALERVGTRLLEPWHRVEVRIPADAVGVVLSELSARRGRIQGLEVNGASARISCECPIRELRTFGQRLHALTGGRGDFSSRPSVYDVLPQNLVKDAMAASPAKSA
jgi:elongation factor G